MRRVSFIDIPNLFDLGFSCFEGFVQIIAHIVPETQRFSVVEKWIQSNDFQEHTESLLRVIDFNNMTVQEFYSGPGQSNLLSDRDKYEIMSKLASNMKNPDNEDTLFEPEHNSKKSKIAFFWSSTVTMWHAAEVCVVGRYNNEIWFQSDTFNTSVEHLKILHQKKSISCGSYFKFVSHFQFLNEKMFFAFTKKKGLSQLCFM